MEATILIIDDEENIRFTLARFLRAEGFKVATADSYEEAITIMNKTQFDTIFVDIILRGRTGIDILKEVYRRGLQCPVIVFSGAPSIETAAEAVKLGAFDYLCKPLRQDTLLQVTRTALRHKALLDEKERYRLNLEAIFKSVQDSIITVDKDLMVLEMNDPTRNICGIMRDEAIGRPFDRIARACGGKCSEALRETINKKRSMELNRVECQSKHHPLQVVTLNTYPLLINGGTFSGAVLVIRDETRFVAMEKYLGEQYQIDGIVGNSPGIRKLCSLIEELATVQSSVLITGESGTGKGLVAKALHYNGARRNNPFVKVNCSALPDSLLESELFGHVSGAFTGAVKGRIGRFEMANGGTIFLDEVADMSQNMQIRLLNVLEDGEITRVGESKPIAVDVRVIAATNRNLEELVKTGKFRGDLYYRLKVVDFVIPPLRERSEDIPILVDHFLRHLNMKLNKQISTISKDVLDSFLRYQWPGNIRELEHTMEYAFILCKTNTIIVDNLPATFGKLNIGAELTELRQTILSALQETHWNKSQAAHLLGLSRQTLYRKIKQLQIGT